MKKKNVLLNPKYTWKYIVYVLVVSAVFFYACGAAKKESVREEKPVPVKEVMVKRQSASIPIHTSGRLSPGVQSKLSFKTGGIVQRLYVDEGQSVKKSQLLASLDLAEINARVVQAQNAFDKAKRDKARVKNLYDDRAATLEQMQDVTTAYDVAKANLDIAHFNLKHSKIHAPANGKILKRMAEINEMISSGYPVFIFGSTDEHWVVKVGVNLRDVVKLTLDDRASVTFDAYPGKQFQAVVSSISEAVDPASGTCEVELTMETPAQPVKWISGFVAAVDIYPALSRMYTFIPIDALVDAEGEKGFVFVVENGKARKVNVTVTHLVDNFALVPDGGELIKKVVTDGAAYLTDGTNVEVVK